MNDPVTMIMRLLLLAATAANVISLINLQRIRRRKREINGDMALAMEMYFKNPTPETVFAKYLKEKYPDGCELGQAIRMYEEWKRERDIPKPLKLLNDEFIVEAITRGVAYNPPDES